VIHHCPQERSNRNQHREAQEPHHFAPPNSQSTMANTTSKSISVLRLRLTIERFSSMLASSVVALTQIKNGVNFGHDFRRAGN